MATSFAGVRQRVTSPEMQDVFKRWFDASPIYSGTPLANRLGWQVVRTVAKNLGIGLRRRVRRVSLPSELARTLDRDGIVAIPDYLPQDRYEAVLRAFEAYGETSDRVRDVGDENGTGLEYRTGPVVSVAEGDPASVVIDALGSDPLLVDLAEYVIGRKVTPPLRIVYQTIRRRSGGEDDLDREQILHADKAFPCAKAIYVLDPLTEASSPFYYAKGSHRITPQRLRYEYAMSVRESLLKRGRLRPATAADDGIIIRRSRNVMGTGFRDRLGIVEEPMTCSGNTMILTNNAGFHRRGELGPDATRRTLWINFYQYQRPWYGKLAFRAAKSFIDTDRVSRALPAVYRQDLEEAAH